MDKLIDVAVLQLSHAINPARGIPDRDTYIKLAQTNALIAIAAMLASILEELAYDRR